MRTLGADRTLTEHMRAVDRYGEPDPREPDFDLEQDGSAELVAMNERIDEMESGPIPHPAAVRGREIMRQKLEAEMRDFPLVRDAIEWLMRSAGPVRRTLRAITRIGTGGRWCDGDLRQTTPSPKGGEWHRQDGA